MCVKECKKLFRKCQYSILKSGIMSTCLWVQFQFVFCAILWSSTELNLEKITILPTRFFFFWNTTILISCKVGLRFISEAQNQTADTRKPKVAQSMGDQGAMESIWMLGTKVSDTFKSNELLPRMVSDRISNFRSVSGSTF